MMVLCLYLLCSVDLLINLSVTSVLKIEILVYTFLTFVLQQPTAPSADSKSQVLLRLESTQLSSQ